jgi:hypothetical protein
MKGEKKKLEKSNWKLASLQRKEEKKKLVVRIVAGEVGTRKKLESLQRKD